MSAVLDLPTLDARARGLGSRLFARAELEEMAGAPNVEALARELENGGRSLAPIERPVTVETIEWAVRHAAVRHLRVLATWVGGSSSILDVFYADQDRRNLRAILRGALQSAPSEARLGALLPTPRLPERALSGLARQPTPAKVAAQLVLLGYPDAARLSALASKAQPVLLELERCLVVAFAERSLVAARAGDRNLRDFARARIDVCNMQMALAFAAGPRDAEPEALFTDGGALLPDAVFLETCAAASAAEASSRLERALGGTPLGDIARSAAGDPVRLESAALLRTLADQRKAARLDPLGSAPLVSFLLRLQAQSIDVLRLAWGACLGAPAELLRSQLVTPWS
ncbi:MAG: V-type ATPase subunit [Polyangiaceae bacterium]